MPLSVVISPDSFKGSLPASAAAGAIADGWREVRPRDDLNLLPQADGGEGTLDAIESAVPGAVRHHIDGVVTGPDGRPVPASWLGLPDGTAVVELAECCGLPLMRTPDALGATTRGLGEVIRVALGSGPGSLVIALGGSASTDGGAGALQQLGLRMLRADGTEIRAGGIGLAELHSVDRSRMLPAPPGGVVLLTDVASPLLGPLGAAAAFGPQKGATAADVERLDRALQGFAELLGSDPDLPGAGAAGGAAYGFIAGWGATVEPGAHWIAKLTGLAAATTSADVVLTGEGRFDATSLRGKVVGEVLSRAVGAGEVPSAAAAIGIVAGSIAVDPPANTWSISLTELAGAAEAAMAEPEHWLRAAGRAAAHHFTLPNP